MMTFASVGLIFWTAWVLSNVVGLIYPPPHLGVEAFALFRRHCIANPDFMKVFFQELYLSSLILHTNTWNNNIEEQQYLRTRY